MLSALVLAAGLGTRLRPLTDLRAKALVPIGDRPAAEHIVDRLRAAGVRRIALNAHHRAVELQRAARAWEGTAISEEPELLGTAGGLARAAALLGSGHVIVWNADIFAEVDVARLVRAHEASAGIEATLVVRPRPRGEGNVGTDSAGRVVRLREEQIGPESRGGEFLGIHVVAETLRARLPERGCLVGDVYIPALHRGATLAALEECGPYYDVGTLPGYLDANRAWLRARGDRSWKGRAALIAPSVELEDTVVGAGASLGGTGVVRGCVVWPGAQANAPLLHAVVAPGGVVLLRTPTRPTRA